MQSVKKKKLKFVDDGRTIANMNVEGMPWYNPTLSDASSKNAETPDVVKVSDDLTPKEKMAMTKGVLWAALLVGGVFALGFTIFILFCVFVWF